MLELQGLMELSAEVLLGHSFSGRVDTQRDAVWVRWLVPPRPMQAHRI